MYSAFLFDLDGTLIRMKLNFARMREDLTKMVGRMDGNLLESIELMPEGRLRTKALRYINTQERRAAAASEGMEGAKECLTYLKEKNKKIGVITRNNRKSSLVSLEKAAITEYVDLILSRDDVERVKPNPDHILIALRELGEQPENSVVVGDHHFEIEAGKKSGCFTVGLLSGSGTKETLKNADLLFNSIQEFYERWVLCKIR
jgi:HAD superfamily hydrolase (TIGR01509 family)